MAHIKMLLFIIFLNFVQQKLFHILLDPFFLVFWAHKFKRMSSLKHDAKMLDIFLAPAKFLYTWKILCILDISLNWTLNGWWFWSARGYSRVARLSKVQYFMNSRNFHKINKTKNEIAMLEDILWARKYQKKNLPIKDAKSGHSEWKWPF